MDAEAVALITAAGTTVANLMATEAWQQTHDGLMHLWQRFRPEHAAEIGRELERRQALVIADRSDDGEAPDAGLGAVWARELPRLLADPQAARELTALLRTCVAAADESSPAQGADDEAQPRAVKVRAKAKGHGQVFVAGRDMTVHPRTDETL